MPVLKIYDDNKKKNLIAVYSGFPWEWDCQKHFLTIWTSKTDAIRYKCQEIDNSMTGKIFYAYQKFTPEEPIPDEFRPF